MALASINPANGEVLATYEELTPDQVNLKLSRAAAAFRTWRGSPFAYRGNVLKHAAEILLNEKDRWARLIVQEMGKTWRSALAEVEKCALTCTFYADHASKFLADERVETGSHCVVRYLPLGVVLAIMPWNFPFWQVFRFLAPTLMAGNAAVLKHASNVPQCALAIEEVMHRAGLPPGVFQTLLLGSQHVASVIRDDRICAVTLTGSEAAGAIVASESGQKLKKCILELGGNDPFIVLPSANLPQAVSAAVQARIINNGQSCVAAKRFIVHDAVYDEFESHFVSAIRRLRIGDPMEADTDVGPLATAAGLTALERQVTRSVEVGARLLVGGPKHAERGNYFPPTVLADVPPQSPAYREEVFGPVAMLFRARSLDHAIEIANDTPFGLGSSVWTNNIEEQDRCALEIEAGQVFINTIVASDPRLPFGGIKLSGYGRELGAPGIREFTNIKTIVTAGSNHHPRGHRS